MSTRISSRRIVERRQELDALDDLLARAAEGARECVNPRFYDWPDSGRDAIRAFDLRDRL